MYVFFTVKATATQAAYNRVSRFTANASNPDVAEAGSEALVFQLDDLSSNENHMGGDIGFGAWGLRCPAMCAVCNVCACMCSVCNMTSALVHTAAVLSKLA